MQKVFFVDSILVVIVVCYSAWYLWRSHHLGVERAQEMGTEVPQRGPGTKPPESLQHITDIWLPHHAQFCVFSQTARAASKA